MGTKALLLWAWFVPWAKFKLLLNLYTEKQEEIIQMWHKKSSTHLKAPSCCFLFLWHHHKLTSGVRSSLEGCAVGTNTRSRQQIASGVFFGGTDSFFTMKIEQLGSSAGSTVVHQAGNSEISNLNCWHLVEGIIPACINEALFLQRKPADVSGSDGCPLRSVISICPSHQGTKQLQMAASEMKAATCCIEGCCKWIHFKPKWMAPVAG